MRRIKDGSNFLPNTTDMCNTGAPIFAAVAQVVPVSAKLVVFAAALLAAAWSHGVRAEKKTVCTITVNSPDEKEVFRRSLPKEEFDFVELVERGRPDWLESACRKGIRCDVLVISGHFDDGTEFYSDRLDAREALPVDELERVSCSDSCPGLFSQLKEVYLFGCNTLEAQPLRSASAEIGRSLLRSGYSEADAERVSRALSELHAESNRDRMRRIFKDVPVIYGFSAKAPLGAKAAPVLERYFQAGAGEIGSGRASSRLLGLLAPSSMTVAAGLRDSEPLADYRRDVCQFSDDRLSAAQKLEFVHRLLGREMAEVRMFLDNIERYVASLTPAERREPAAAGALDAIARDLAARNRFLEFTRDADQPAIRARMIRLAGDLGWLSPAEQRAELMRMLGDRLSRNAVGSAEVDLACSLNEDGKLGPERYRLQLSPAEATRVTDAAVLACLGSAEGHARVLHALTSPRNDDVQIAQVYLRHRPIADAGELRAVAASAVQMDGSDAQARALETLASYRLSDRDTLEQLVRLFPRAKSVNVQRAIAGILIRSDYRAIATPGLAGELRRHRLKSPDGYDVIDVLIRRLEAP